MANRYDTPAQSNYINTYVPIPFQEMALALGEKQRQYELGASRTDEFRGGLNDFLTSPGKDELDYAQKMTGFDNSLNDLQDQTPDFGSLEYRTGLNRIIRNFVRDPWIRNAKQNRENYINAVQQLAEVKKAGANPWNIKDAEDKLNFMFQHGTQGLIDTTGSGYFQPGDVYDNVDINDAISTRMADFQKEGYHVVRNANGGLQLVDKSGNGIPLSKTAFGLGLNEDLSLSESGPDARLWSEIGPELLRKALFMADQPGEERTPEQIALDEYTRLAVPAALQYSGMTTGDIEKFSPAGYSALKTESPDNFSITSYLTVKRPFSKWQDPNRADNKWALLKNAETLSDPATVFSMAVGELGGVAGIPLASKLSSAINDIPFYKTAAHPIEGERITALAKLIQENTITPEEATKLIDEHRNKVIAKFDGDKILGSLAQRSLSTYYNYLKDVTNIAYQKFAPKGLDDRYEGIYNKLVKTGQMNIPSGDYSDLTEEQKTIAWDAIRDEITRFNQEAVQIPVKTVDDDYTASMNKKLFGSSASTGHTLGKVISGIASTMKVIDPENPLDIKTLNEHAKKAKGDGDNVPVNYIGPLEEDNPYGPGMHYINIGGKDLIIQIPGIDSNDPQNPLTRSDMADQLISNRLFNYRNDAGGVGEWFPQGGYYLRAVGTDWEQYADPYGGSLVKASNPILQYIRADEYENNDFSDIQQKMFDPTAGDRNITDTYDRWVIQTLNAQKQK